ncbi:HlyD family secretion protein [Pseudomonas sp. EA_15y_Pfl2_R67]|uniref:HlyD family secretion protein n=1 Tax=Pseudomonas sp. EA_15y_Pfl2_R67 TaxID=3088687 RepID=UPI0030DC605D
MTDNTVERPALNTSTIGLYRNQSVSYKQSYTGGVPHIGTPLSGWLVAAACLAMLSALSLFLIFAKYTHKEKVHGQLAPASGVFEIASNDEGIITQILVDDGARVVQGQLLAVVEKGKTGADLITSTANDISNYALQISNIQKTIKNISAKHAKKLDQHAVYVALIKSKQHHVQEQIKLNNLLLSKQKILVQHMSELEAISAVSNIEAQAQMDKLSNLKTLNEQLKNEQLTLDQELANENQQYTQFTLDSDILKNSHEKDILQITRRMRSATIDNAYSITAPNDGKILAVKVYEGQRVNKLQSLLSFTSGDSPLVAQITIPDRALPFLKLNDRVSIKYNPFPYQKFGQFGGSIKSISNIPIDAGMPSTTSPNAQVFYKATVTLDQQNLMVNDGLSPLKAGYTLEAEIITESRSLLEWMIAPFIN